MRGPLSAADIRQRHPLPIMRTMYQPSGNLRGFRTPECKGIGHGSASLSLSTAEAGPIALRAARKAKQRRRAQLPQRNTRFGGVGHRRVPPRPPRPHSAVRLARAIFLSQQACCVLQAARHSIAAQPARKNHSFGAKTAPKNETCQQRQQLCKRAACNSQNGSSPKKIWQWKAKCAIGRGSKRWNAFMVRLRKRAVSPGNRGAPPKTGRLKP